MRFSAKAASDVIATVIVASARNCPVEHANLPFWSPDMPESVPIPRF
jgi:hypothetical protein